MAAAATKRKAKGKKRSAAASRETARETPPEAPAETPSTRKEPTRPTWKTHALIALAAVYLATVWLDGVGSSLPAKVAPRPWVFFGQIAALFKWAGEKQIDYRAEGWSCADQRWVEIDVLPFFPLDAENKENRFYRAVQFYRRDRKVMRALDEFVVTRHNARGAAPRIGGVRLLSLRVPYPEVGSTIQPYRRKELATYPEDQRHNWYWTPGSKRRERCGDRAPAPAMDDDGDHAHAPASHGPEDER